MPRNTDVTSENETIRLLSRPEKGFGLWSTSTTAASKLTLFDLTFDNMTLEGAVHRLITAAKNKQRTTVAFVNAHTINTSEANPAYTRVLNRADCRFADGSGLAIAARMARVNLRDNINGTDMLPVLARKAAKNNLSIYFFGARPGVAAKAAANLHHHYPHLKIAGSDHGFYRSGSEEEDQAIERINASGADILLVALGVPAQDIWLAANRDRLKPTVRMGVGGLFDFFAGHVTRAPLFVRRFGMEWAWRLGNEPIRLGRRYVIGNATFLRHSLRRCMTGHAVNIAPGDHRVGAFARTMMTAARTGRQVAQRTLDIAISGTALALLWPVMATVAFAIRRESPGPALFLQTRTGTRGKPFTMYKFRSMYTGADRLHAGLQGQVSSDHQIRFKAHVDPRVTRVGRLLRKTSLDELPQLINVLKGDMSIVGPRPALPSEVRHYSLEHRDRLLVKPGITCTWQISGRADIDFVGQVALDKEYARNRSVASDLAIMVKTLPAVLSGRGAY